MPIRRIENPGQAESVAVAALPACNVGCWGEGCWLGCWSADLSEIRSTETLLKNLGALSSVVSEILSTTEETRSQQ